MTVHFREHVHIQNYCREVDSLVVLTPFNDGWRNVPYPYLYIISLFPLGKKDGCIQVWFKVNIKYIYDRLVFPSSTCLTIFWTSNLFWKKEPINIVLFFLLLLLLLLKVAGIIGAPWEEIRDTSGHLHTTAIRFDRVHKAEQNGRKRGGGKE